MSYVSRYAHDVFLSYAHNDDRAWIEAFERSLRQELADRLGYPVSLWQDDNQLRLGQNWRTEIEDAIKGTAIFLAVVSPSYRTSDWCGRERKLFVGQFPSIAEMKLKTKSGESYRFLKVVKMPWPEDAHLEFFGEAQHVDFFSRDASNIADELVPGTEFFQVSMRRTAHAIASILLGMRRMGETVFVATSTEDVSSAEKALSNELSAQGYDVQPEGPLDELFSDNAIRKLIDPAVLSVHLLGAQYDPIVERLSSFSRDLKQKQVFWLSREAETAPSEKQRALVDSIYATGHVGPPPTILTGPASRMIGDILQILLPGPEDVMRASTNANGNTSVYVICDPSSPEDASFGAELGQELRSKEGFDVFLPEKAATSRTMIEAHDRKLRDCDGVLLYRNRAPVSWFSQHYGKVMLADRIEHREKPLRSKAILLDDPSLLPGNPNVIQRTKPFELVALETFLGPLRSRGGSAAHA